MTDQTPERADMAAQSEQTEPAVEPQTEAEQAADTARPSSVQEEVDEIRRISENRMERHKKAPLVTVSVRIETGAESWLTSPDDAVSVSAAVAAEMLIADTDDNEAPIWNRRYRVRGGDRTILARRMGVAFTFEDHMYREFQGRAGDWLIREDDSGYVFALTDHAMQFMFEPAPEQAAAQVDPT